MDGQTGLRYSLRLSEKRRKKRSPERGEHSHLAQRARAAASETAEQARAVLSRCAETKVAAQHLRAESSGQAAEERQPRGRIVRRVIDLDGFRSSQGRVCRMSGHCVAVTTRLRAAREGGRC